MQKFDQKCPAVDGDDNSRFPLTKKQKNAAGAGGGLPSLLSTPLNMITSFMNKISPRRTTSPVAAAHQNLLHESVVSTATPRRHRDSLATRSGAHLQERFTTDDVRTKRESEQRRHGKIQSMELPSGDYRPPNFRYYAKIKILHDGIPENKFIRHLIGTQGKLLRALENDAGARIIIPEKSPDELLYAYVLSTEREALERCCRNVRRTIALALLTFHKFGDSYQHTTSHMNQNQEYELNTNGSEDFPNGRTVGKENGGAIGVISSATPTRGIGSKPRTLRDVASTPKTPSSDNTVLFPASPKKAGEPSGSRKTQTPLVSSSGSHRSNSVDIRTGGGGGGGGQHGGGANQFNASRTPSSGQIIFAEEKRLSTLGIQKKRELEQRRHLNAPSTGVKISRGKSSVNEFSGADEQLRALATSTITGFKAKALEAKGKENMEAALDKMKRAKLLENTMALVQAKNIGNVFKAGSSAPKRTVARQGITGPNLDVPLDNPWDMLDDYNEIDEALCLELDPDEEAELEAELYKLVAETEDVKQDDLLEVPCSSKQASSSSSSNAGPFRRVSGGNRLS